MTMTTRHHVLLRALCGLCALCVPLGFSSSAAAQEMRPGKYKTVMTGEVQGRQMKPMPDEDCFTKKDIDEGLARATDKDSECKAGDIKRGPGTIAYTMTCVEDGKKRTGTMAGRFTSDTFDFNMTMTGQAAAKVNVKGTRIGECK